MRAGLLQPALRSLGEGGAICHLGFVICHVLCPIRAAR
jgi:hypothetical protein